MWTRTLVVAAVVALGAITGCDRSGSRSKTALEHYVQSAVEIKVALREATPENEQGKLITNLDETHQKVMARLNTSGEGDTPSRSVVAQLEQECEFWEKEIKEAEARISFARRFPDASTQKIIAANEKMLVLLRKALEIKEKHLAEITKILAKA